MTRTTAALLGAAVVSLGLAACGTVEYTSPDGKCLRFEVQSTQVPEGTLYNGVLQKDCPPAPTSTVTVTPPTTTTTTITTTPPPAGGHPLNLPRVAWEGGPSYYAQWPSMQAWNNPSLFPIGVWFESVLSQSDVNLDKSAGLNTYVELTSNTQMALIRDNGMYAITQGPRSGYGSETVSWLISDEVDMRHGPGWDGWDGVDAWGHCTSSPGGNGACGYTVSADLMDRQPKDGRPFYANYGKGVMMWESFAEAAGFVNGGTNPAGTKSFAQRTVSADMYFYTDPNLTAEIPNWWGYPQAEVRKAANYGDVIRRMRNLDGADGARIPVLAFVEVGHPFSEADAPTITGPQIRGAVWSSLIAGARGVLYFNHNFGGPCISQHVLRDQCGAAVRSDVTAVNTQIRELAPVLNTQTLEHTFSPGMDTMLKWHAGSYYLFAMTKRATPTGQHTLTLPAGLDAASAEVLYENRTVPITGGVLTDTWSQEYGYHIYKITP